LLGVFLYLFIYLILGRSANFHLDYSPNGSTLLMILTVFLLRELLSIVDLKWSTGCVTLNGCPKDEKRKEDGKLG
jgi:hypothetical protein